MTIDLSPLASAAIQFGVVALSVLGPVAMAAAANLLRKHGLLKDAQTQATLAAQADELLNKAVVFGASKFSGALAQKPLLVNPSTPQIAAAVNFAIIQGPQLLKDLGFDVTTQSGQAAIARMIAARL